MRLRHIEVFQAVMQTGSMSSAGRLIHLTQPAVSKLISSAEAQLGFPLFHRTEGRLVPTAEALALFASSSELFENLESFKRTAMHLRGGQGRLRVGAIPAISHKLIPDALAEFRRKHPSVVVEVHTLHKRQLTQELLTRDIDVSFDFYGVAHPGIAQKQLASGAVYLMLSSKHTKARAGASPGIAEVRHALTRAPMIALVDEDPLTMSFSRYCQLQGIQPECSTLVQTSQLAEELVARGVGWTVVDFVTAAHCGPDVRVAQLFPLIECTLHAFSAKNFSPPLIARQFTECVKGSLARSIAKKES